MTKRQYKRAVALIKKDCQIKGHYVDGDGNTCALGCLALAAGVKKQTLENHNSSPIEWVETAYRKIKTKFGISLNQQSKIMGLNDSSSKPETRRKHIVRYLKTLLP